APTLLIGHSLGGTAVLAAAERIAEAKAVVTIGAPASPEHVIAQFGADAAVIDRDGKADVSLSGRKFSLDKSFLDDLRQHSMSDRIRRLRKALLIMHAPLDDVVAIDQAARIFEAALHPKSFISLDEADHLLRRAEDAEFVASTVAGWAARYFVETEQRADAAVTSGHVRVTEENQRFLRRVATDDHNWLSDEPTKVGGDNLGPDPYEQLLAALGTCTSMTLRMYAHRKKWQIDDIHIELEHLRDHGVDCERCDEPDQVIDVIQKTIRIDGDLDDTQRERLLEIADRCPVHKTLTGDLRIETKPLEP
ncbi:MAG: OsmC family protein, partial [Gammaproteobacteria bacterium]|nr:OsmC family protein [Gammaproteobacteria bacterium]